MLMQSDLYVDGLLPASALLGVFCDVGLLRWAQSPLDAADRRQDPLDRACGVGISLRYAFFCGAHVCLMLISSSSCTFRVLGLRADYGYRLDRTPRSLQLHLGFDRGN